MKKTLFYLICLVSMASGCANNPARVSHNGEPIPQDHFAEIQRPDIPLVMNDHVQDWLNYFQGRGRPHFERYLKRSGKYIPMMRKILRKHGMPEDLVYLSMIESGFNPHAYSRARATGAWQFIYHTGIRYGLSVNSWVDERRDPEKSTVAAAKYLKDLYDRYNNWYLAAAGYNAGEGKIDRAIRKYDTQDFWELSTSKRRYLRSETKNYVPKLIAAAMIAKNPDQYGFKNIEYEEPIPFEEVTLDSPMDLRVAARCTGSSYEDMKALNPELLHWVTPPNYRSYRLKIPTKTEDRFSEECGKLAPGDYLGEEKVTLEKSASVAVLARAHGTNSILLAAANGVSPSGVLSKGAEVTIPLNPPPGESFREANYTGSGGKAIVYRVRNGDNIAKVSRKTGISVASLRKHNTHVEWSSLKSGQKLHLYSGAKAKSSVSKAKAGKTKSKARPAKKSKGKSSKKLKPRQVAQVS